MTETTTSTKTIDPGPPPYCPVCGGRQVAVPNNQSHYGVCVGCATVVKPEISVGGEIRPFFVRVSELMPLTKDVVQLREKIRARYG